VRVIPTVTGSEEEEVFFFESLSRMMVFPKVPVLITLMKKKKKGGTENRVKRFATLVGVRHTVPRAHGNEHTTPLPPPAMRSVGLHAAAIFPSFPPLTSLRTPLPFLSCCLPFLLPPFIPISVP
jgi:hypothetical protein